MEARDVGAKRSSGCHTWGEDTTTAEFGTSVVLMGLLIKLVDPPISVMLVSHSGFAEVCTLVPHNWDWLDVGQALEDDAEVADSVFGGVLIHLIEVGAEASGYHVDLRLLHSA